MAFGLVAQQLVRLGILSTSDHASVVSINLFVALLCGCIVIGHLLEESRWINESITALVIVSSLFLPGLPVGSLHGGRHPTDDKGEELAHFRVQRRPLLYLPSPAYYIQCRGPQIIQLATVILAPIQESRAIELFRKMDIGSLDIGDFLAIGAIFSATDSVCTLQVLNQDETPLLYSLVFGEGVVNDATSVVLFNAIQNFDLVHIDAIIILKFVGNFGYLFLSSTLLGAFGGLLSAYIIKKLYIGRHAFATLSFIAETFLFLYVGMDALDIEKWRFVSDSPGKSLRVSAILLGLVLVGRAAFVFPLSFLSNLTKKSTDERIIFKQQVTIWWAGLMRGAVSIALAYNQVFGLMTKPLIRFLLPHSAKHLSSMSSEPSTPKSLLSPFLENGQGSEVEVGGEFASRPSSLRMLLSKPTHTVHYYWRKFDNAFMRPMFGGRGFVPFFPGSPTEQSTHNWQ
ncbi:hypothetical protein C4D60_Mb08t22310 [Musa balbisiana]|uniref:Cation/H+ exchanger transmembrane domain-containing protein n=1 Tax=Musa balbisiana TaxID=52838 RepID=A0A4S8K5M6_MUSBA|nr:hypothetical protein C4D60_Mb08t22310 [Musa balbisiana]